MVEATLFARISTSSKRHLLQNVLILYVSGWYMTSAKLYTKRKTLASSATESRSRLPRYSTSDALTQSASSTEYTPEHSAVAGASG
jgi:hypothetical protein